MKFEDCLALFDADKMQTLAASAEGLLWLKLKSISRKQILGDFMAAAKIDLPDKLIAKEQFRKIYELLVLDVEKSAPLLDQFIKNHAPAKSAQELEKIASELHKMRAFLWGGDYSNALDKFLVDRYIKRINTYDGISGCLKTEIPSAVEGYVLCSWYNHWSTFLIENVFFEHPKVLPAIGQVKKIDFFVDDVPFDLKTTYLPANYVETRRKAAGIPSELSVLKAAAKMHGISFDENGRAKSVAYEISERIRTSGSHDARLTLFGLWNFRRNLLDECQKDPTALIKNLYEEQGAMRFDASNRLFVVLADKSDFDNSWKLKRNPTLLRKAIHAYLDSFSKGDAHPIEFKHKARAGDFSAISDVICVFGGES